MWKLATILDNPGEPPAETQYRDPARLVELGYDGLVLFEPTSLSGLERPAAVRDADMRRWVEQQLSQTRERARSARASGLSVFFVYDVLTLGRERVAEEADRLTCHGAGQAICPGRAEAIEACAQALTAMFEQIPEADGVVLRFGDNDAWRYPHLVGNEIYSPSCAQCRSVSAVDRVATLLQRFHEHVVQQLGKVLIARAWNVRPGGMHDSTTFCEQLAARLPAADERFILSFKFTETDFWRHQRWNPPSRLFGDRPILYELQCQREYEGKGGIPNWQAPLWRDGHPERPGDHGLAQAREQVNLAGIWAWVRGGGWGGPFLKNETWIDANVVAAPRLADAPDADPDALAREWVQQRLGVSDSQLAEAIVGLLQRSSDFVRRGFYVGPYAENLESPWHPNGDLIRDDLVDAEAAWRIVQRLPRDRMDEVVQEKRDAVDQVARARVTLQNHLAGGNRRVLEPMVDTLSYTESLFEMLRDLFAGLVAYRRYREEGGSAYAAQCQERLLSAQSHWNHHTQRHGTLPGTATAFRESHFWERTQRILDEVS